MSSLNPTERLIKINSQNQTLSCYEGVSLSYAYPISTGKNGMGERLGSECTPRGWHAIHRIIGRDHQENSVFVGRQWTNEIYTSELAAQFPNRDWILTRILQLEGLEPGKNQGGEVDSLARYIYIHGTPDTTLLGTPGSRGCVRMRNADIIALANWVKEGLRVYIE